VNHGVERLKDKRWFGLRYLRMVWYVCGVCAGKCRAGCRAVLDNTQHGGEVCGKFNYSTGMIPVLKVRREQCRGEWGSCLDVGVGTVPYKRSGYTSIGS